MDKKEDGDLKGWYDPNSDPAQDIVDMMERAKDKGLGPSPVITKYNTPMGNNGIVRLIVAILIVAALVAIGAVRPVFNF